MWCCAKSVANGAASAKREATYAPAASSDEGNGADAVGKDASSSSSAPGTPIFGRFSPGHKGHKSPESASNKLIEKQIKRDKKVYRATQRLQLVGLSGSGKTTVIQQMGLLNQPDRHLPAEEREKFRDLVRTHVKTAVLIVIRRLPPELRTDSREELLTYGKEGAVLDERFYKLVAEFWTDLAAKEFVRQAEAGGAYPQLSNLDHFFDRISVVGRPDYVPSAEDALKMYSPTVGVMERRIRMEQTEFNLCEVRTSKS